MRAKGMNPTNPRDTSLLSKAHPTSSRGWVNKVSSAMAFQVNLQNMKTVARKPNINIYIYLCVCAHVCVCINKL